jgi:hypothetical protein
MNKTVLVAACLFWACMAFIFSSCWEELSNVDRIESTAFQPSIDFPLVNSDFSMEEFLTKGKSKAQITEQNGVMVLTYDDSVATPSGDFFFTVPDQHSPVLSVTGPEVSFPSPGATITISKTVTFGFNTSQSESLDSILLKAGQTLFKINSTFPANISLKISVPSLRIQNAAFQKSFSFTGAGNQTSSTSMQGAVLDLTSASTSTNKITFTITATITDTGQPINSTHHIDCSFDVTGLAFRALFGDLGTHAFQFATDTIDVDVFGNTVSGTVEFLSPAITFTMRNSFGLPIGFNLQNIAAIKSDKTVIPLSGSAMNAPANPYLLNAPGYNQIGRSVTSSIALNSGNSNLAQLISSLPRYLTHRVSSTLNPGGATKNFVLDTSKVSIGVHLELPFHGKVSSLSISKQYDFNGLGIDNVQQSKIKVKTVNETPLDAHVQVYFVDISGAVLDSLFTNSSILKGAPVDASGNTQGAAEVTTEVAVTQAKVDRIEQAEYIRIATVLYTTNNGTVPVKFSSTDGIKVNIGVSTQLKYNVN